MNTSPRLPQPNIFEDINYIGSDTEYSCRIVGQDVTVHCNSGNHTHGSSKVKLIDRIDYNWEFNYYRGQLVAVHIDGKVVAYGMKGKDGGMVRVTNQETSQRALIKNLKNDVKDISFAFSRQQIVLGCIDDEGNVLIYEITDEPNSIKFELLLHVNHSDIDSPHTKFVHRIIWCPYLTCFDDEDSDDDPEKMFVILNGDKAEIYNYGIINAKHGPGPIQPDESLDGYIEISHVAELIDASFSSDGTAIAVASIDGYVKFFQIDILNNVRQKCLHEWTPHGNKILSSIIFVDNLLESGSQCWKFTITGASNNSEFKLWSCETWKCLQTIRFISNPTSLIQNIFMKLSIDYTGQYLVLSDINNKALYVLQLKRNEETKQIFLTTLSRFLLPTTFLSFHITEASCRKLRPSDVIEEFSLEPDEEDEDEDDEDFIVQTTVIKMLVIQQKKFQECNIVFRPETMLYKTDIVDNFEEKVPELNDLQPSVTLLIKQHQQLTLMTPEAFTLTEQNSRPSSVRNSLNGDINKSTKQTPEVSDNLIDFQRPEKDNFASGGSSPSREVQEILSLNNSTYSTQDYFENLTTMQEQQEVPQKEYNHPENLIFPENANTDMMWLKLPLVKDNEIVKDENLRQELRLGGGDEIANLSDSELSKTHLQAINFRLTALENSIADLNLAVQEIHQSVKGLNQTTKETGPKDDYLKEIEVAMSKQQLQLAKMFENLVLIQKDKERDQQDNIVANVSQKVTKSINDKLQNIVTQETKHVVIPAIRSLIDNLKHQLDVQNSQKLSSDMVLQDKITKMVNSKALAESLSLSVATVITPILEKCYRDMIASTLVPSWERVCGNMFQQINETFTQGTKEYTASVENYMERQRRVQERGKDLITQMQTISENFQSNAEKVTMTLTNGVYMQLNNAVLRMQESLTQNVKEIVSEQIKLGFKNHAATLEDSVINAVRSRAVTPSPHNETQVTVGHLDSLLGKENYDEAFQLALSAENLNYVIYVCEKVDTNALFNGSSPPQQHCILSLIQQLSVELTKHTETKLNYIRAALVALIPGYPQTKQFIPKVLRDLLKQLQLFMTTNTNSKFTTEAKLLKMVVESILDK